MRRGLTVRALSSLQNWSLPVSLPRSLSLTHTFSLSL
jgi:hypothetical protein